MKKLISTLGLSRAEWLKYRKCGIGGSDAAAVVGLNPYSSQLKVFYDKTNPQSVSADKDNEAMRQGRDLEDYVAKRFSEETGFKVRRANALFIDDLHPWMIADVDRLIVGQKAGLECKTVSPYMENKWEDGDIPLHYQIQSYHYMAVTGLREWYVAALIFGREFIIRKVEWDDDVIGGLRQIEKDFWFNHVQKNVPPGPDGSETTNKILSDMYGPAKTGASIALKGFAERLAHRSVLAAKIDELNYEKNIIEQELKMYLGDNEAAEGEGYIVRWANINQNRIDVERLKKENPQVYEAFLKPTRSRRLTIKKAVA